MGDNAILFGSQHRVSLNCAGIIKANGMALSHIVVSGKEINPASYYLHTMFPDVPFHVTDKPHLNPLIVADARNSDWLLSCFYDHRIREPLLSAPSIGAINLHPAVLPYNRGRHSAFWGIMRGTPLGATLHWMDEDFDTGPIIAQARFEDDGLMTAHEVYRRQCDLCVRLFREWLPRLLSGERPAFAQVGEATYHNAYAIAQGSTLPMNASVIMRDVFKLIRATSMDDYGFWVNDADGGRRFKIKARITAVEEVPTGD